MNTDTEDFERLKAIITREKKIIAEISSLGNYMRDADIGEQRIIDSQIDIMQQTLRRSNEEIPLIIGKIMGGTTPIMNVPGKNLPGSTPAAPAAQPAPKTPAEVQREKTPLKSLPEPVKVNTLSKEPGKGSHG